MVHFLGHWILITVLSSSLGWCKVPNADLLNSLRSINKRLRVMSLKSEPCTPGMRPMSFKQVSTVDLWPAGWRSVLVRVGGGGRFCHDWVFLLSGCCCPLSLEIQGEVCVDRTSEDVCKMQMAQVCEIAHAWYNLSSRIGKKLKFRLSFGASEFTLLALSSSKDPLKCVRVWMCMCDKWRAHESNRCKKTE